MQAKYAAKKLKAAIVGSGNIGTDLMIKILRHGRHLEMGAMVGIDPASDGLARAQRLGVATTAEGVEGLARLPVFADIDVVFDATSAAAHVRNDAFLRGLKPGIRMVDLTDASSLDECARRIRHAGYGQSAQRRSTGSTLRWKFAQPLAPGP